MRIPEVDANHGDLLYIAAGRNNLVCPILQQSKHIGKHHAAFVVLIDPVFLPADSPK
jgi:hypothetical protein